MVVKVKTTKSVKAKPGFKKLAKAVASFTKKKNRRILRRPGDRVYRKIPLSTEASLFAILDTVHDVFDRPTEKKNYQNLLFDQFPTEFTKKGMDIDSFVRIVYNFPNAMNLGGRDMKVFMHDKTLACRPTFRFDQSTDNYMNILNKFLCTKQKRSNLGLIKRNYLIQSLWRATKTTYILTQQTNVCHLTSNKFSCQVMQPPQFLHFVETFGIHVAVDAEKYTKEETRSLNPNSMPNSMMFGNSTQAKSSRTNINFIINPSQIVDPATTSKHENMHFVFPPRTKLSSTSVQNLFGFQHSTNKTTIFQCNALNPQFTCDFQIFVEVPSTWEKNYPQLFQNLSSNIMIKNTNLIFLQNTLRFYVISRLKDDKYAPYAPILCIQNTSYGSIGKDRFQNKHDPNIERSKPWFIKNSFQGLSVQECYKMTHNAINMVDNNIDKKWLIRHYLDWKRMGDSFQINMLGNIINSYNSVAKKNTVVYDNKNPSKPFTYEMIYYFFASNDLLAIIQAIKNKIPFIGEYQGNYFAGHTMLSNKVKGYNQLHGLIAKRSINKQKLTRSNSNRRASGLARTLSRQSSNVNARLTRTPSRQSSTRSSDCPPCRPCPPCREYMYNQTLTSLPPRKRLRPSRYQS